MSELSFDQAHVYRSLIARIALIALMALIAQLAACGRRGPAEQYGFLTTLGTDTVSLERVTHRDNAVLVDGVDRFPRVRIRHAEIALAPDGGIRHLVMDIDSPNDSAKRRKERVVADVTADSVIMTKRDGTGALRWAFATGGATVMAHVPMMYSLYELYFASAMRRMAAGAVPGDTVRMRQFYIDREFDRFPLHRAVVRKVSATHAQIYHDWLSGVGDATLDSSFHLLSYSGAGTTYKVDVTRLATPPDIAPVAAAFAQREASQPLTAMSPRDMTRASLGDATLLVDYSRPLQRGRRLIGDVIPFGYVWRTGANAATQFSTSAPITLAGIPVPAGKYTLWTIPKPDGSATLIVNKQTGQWGTDYNPRQDLARAPLRVDSLATPVERFTIGLDATGPSRGMMTLAWGNFRWTAPIEVRR